MTAEFMGNAYVFEKMELFPLFDANRRTGRKQKEGGVKSPAKFTNTESQLSFFVIFQLTICLDYEPQFTSSHTTNYSELM